MQEDPYGTRLWRTTMVQLSGKNRALNEYSIERVGEKVDDNLVILHGYGAGLGFFYKNFEPLSRHRGWRLYALDMLGMGNSARPPFRIRAKELQAKILEAEDWFIDSLEEWRRIRKIDRFTLLAHSLGGYLAVSYALKYPGHLSKLILASPVGIPKDPYAVDASLPEPHESRMQSEFVDDQESIASGRTSIDLKASAAAAARAGHNNFLNSRARAEAEAAKKAGSSSSSRASSTSRSAGNGTATPTKATPPPKRPLPGWFVWLWDANVSPFSLVRLTGPLGPRFVSGWTSRRFNHLPGPEAQALHEYSYALFRQRGSGEYALPYILAPGAYARRPVIDRIDQVGRQTIVTSEESESSGSGSNSDECHIMTKKGPGIPIVFLYGENDWMDVAGGFAAEEKLRQRRLHVLRHGTPEEKRAERGSAKVIIVQRAGHHLYIDNADEFNEIMAQEMAETRRWGLEMRGRSE